MSATSLPALLAERGATTSAARPCAPAQRTTPAAPLPTGGSFHGSDDLELPFGDDPGASGERGEEDARVQGPGARLSTSRERASEPVSIPCAGRLSVGSSPRSTPRPVHVLGGRAGRGDDGALCVAWIPLSLLHDADSQAAAAQSMHTRPCLACGSAMQTRCRCVLVPGCHRRPATGPGQAKPDSTLMHASPHFAGVAAHGPVARAGAPRHRHGGYWLHRGGEQRWQRR